MIGRDCALGGKVVSGLQQSLHLKPVRNSCLAVVGLDLLLGLSMVRRCSLNRSFKRRFVSPMYF